MSSPANSAPSKQSQRETIPEVISRLFAARPTITSSEVAEEAGVSRQAAHYHLSRMVKDGLLVQEGARRSSHYRQKAQRTASYQLEGLTEHEVWGTERIALRELDPEIEQTSNLLQILNFTFTEMVNNAIDHSHGSKLTIRWFLEDHRVTFDVEDDGVGAFAEIRQSRGLADDFQAIGELSKGKQTTDPTRHSGLGIFFSSRMVNRFTLAANRLVWIVDNDLGDTAIGWLDRVRVGTLVRCEIRRDTSVTPQQVFDRLADPLTKKFNRTTLRVQLFEEGDFVSRTEAKLIGARLEGFEVVELDFSGVDRIGQGFADELFRVWANEHPGTELVPINANPAIASLISSVEHSSASE